MGRAFTRLRIDEKSIMKYDAQSPMNASPQVKTGLNLLTSRLSPAILIPVIAGLSMIGYLFASRLTYRIGFPLDDAWIHQTYARNLVNLGQMAYWPGQPSAGSTSPLWTGLLAAGLWLGLDLQVWTFFLGGLSLVAIGLVGMAGFRSLCPKRPSWAILAGILLVLEWHLVWAAGSGMETLLFALLVLWILISLVSKRVNWLAIGLGIGVSVWLRPDGITLVGPALLVLLLGKSNQSNRWRGIGLLMLGIGVFLIPYLLFNKSLSGSWLPNTYFAKQAEYAILRTAPIWQRFFGEAALPLIGVGLLLLPGFGLIIYHSVKNRAWGILVGAIWVAGYLWLYAWRLPVTYQHGRYIIPVLPIFSVWSLAGFAIWFDPASPSFWKRVVGKAWLVAASLVLLAFWGLGARTYAQDVAVIESEMVDTARWVAENTRPDSVIAAHDIGALGYFGGRKLLDLAGLASPQVIPFLRDENQLGIFLDTQKAEYLVTFPDWYPELIHRAELIYSTGGNFSPKQGGENMGVYVWRGR
jgi:hypothetical protein